jgi:triphosphoribosyl-dephospho-CoA synthase
MYLRILAERADTLVARKRGAAEAERCRQGAARVLGAGWPDTPPGRSACLAFDEWLRAEGHARNPGATADLTAAALFAALRDGTIELPRPAGPSAWSGG